MGLLGLEKGPAWPDITTIQFSDVKMLSLKMLGYVVLIHTEPHIPQIDETSHLTLKPI